MTDLSGQHALITGAGSGIGECMARALSDAGARLTLVGRRLARLQGVADDLPNAVALAADVTDEAQIAATLSAAHDAHGPVDVLIANAGAADSAPLARTTTAMWQAMLAVNLTGVFLCARGVLPQMLERGAGRIVTVASTAGLKGYPYVTAYCAAKHGVVGFTRALAIETAASGITVNAICPGYIDTPLLQRSIDAICAQTGRSAEQVRASLMRSNPQGRFVTPQEVADTALWLLSPGAASVTGQAIALSGGEI